MVKKDKFLYIEVKKGTWWRLILQNWLILNEEQFDYKIQLNTTLTGVGWVGNQKLVVLHQPSRPAL